MQNDDGDDDNESNDVILPLLPVFVSVSYY